VSHFWSCLHKHTTVLEWTHHSSSFQQRQKTYTHFVKFEVGIKCPGAFNISSQGFLHPYPLFRQKHKTKLTFYFAPFSLLLSSLSQIQLDVFSRTLMAHELRNSINKGRESNIQKAISIQIKNPSSPSIPLRTAVNLTLLVLNISLTPGYLW
jgi:hypothetical protein